MKLTIEREHLANALPIIKHIVDVKASIPVHATVLLSGEDGTLTLKANCLDMAASAEVPYAGDDAHLCAPLYMLEALASASGSEVTLTVETETGRLLGESGRYRLRDLFLTGDEFPEGFASGDGVSWEMPAADLRWLLASTVGAREMGGGRHYLEGVHFTIDDGLLTAVAIDGGLMCVAKSEVADLEALPDNVILHGDCCAELIRFCGQLDKDAIVEIDLCDANIAVRGGTNRFWSKLIDGQYPDWRRVLNGIQCEPSLDLDCDALGKSLGRIAVAPKSDVASGEHDPSGTIRISADEDTVTIGVRTRDAAIFDELDSVHEGEWPDRFVALARFKVLLAGLKAGNMERVTLETGEGIDAPIKFRHSLSDRYYGALFNMKPPIVWRVSE